MHGLPPDQIINKLRSDAAAKAADASVPAYGYTGDPNSPLVVDSQTRYYGHLAWAGGY